MELNYVMTILDRDRREALEEIIQSLQLPFMTTMMARGTATDAHLSKYGLTMTEKAAVSTVADSEETKKLLKAAIIKLYIDIPGNGIMMSLPIKSVGGSSTLAYLTDNKPNDGKKPKMEFAHELIYVIFNEGHSEDVMAAARPAGATGGTVLSAKGTGIRQSEKFMGLSLADEREVLLIVARSEAKAAIMKAIIEKAGPDTKAGALCFSMPVTDVVGLRHVEE